MPEARSSTVREQYNYGSGTFIAGDNFGDRYETLDTETKAVMVKLSKDAPALAGILEKALRDGVISPRAVAALEHAVQNINEDVASSLRLAGRNINEDVAGSLRLAGRSINREVAREIGDSAGKLEETVDQLCGPKGEQRINDLLTAASTLDGAVLQIEDIAAPFAAYTLRRAKFRAFICGTAAGFLIGLLMILIIAHHAKH